MTQTILITGANRGIGLGFVRHYLAQGATVYACSRSPDTSRELWELERDYGTRCKLLRLDVSDDADVANAAHELGDRALDLLINNAGVLPHGSAPFTELPLEDMRRAFEVNVLGPLRMTRALLPNLERASRPMVATLSSKMGSIADNTSGGHYAYRVSKSAVNMLMKCFAIDFPRISTVILHPGWVQTDMGGPEAPTSVEESVTGMARVLSELPKGDSGVFLDFRGARIAW